ncbi:sensor histidine kinase [Bacillus rubiinfantis]|uniref:sensor histidine kinase n=1 Tax=Bacillus rubiinfantis TaxID=1499680 RepID=UPI001652B643|nr:sensor histidine kinase [Bacillus rubiinfantis]
MKWIYHSFIIMFVMISFVSVAPMGSAETKSNINQGVMKVSNTPVQEILTLNGEWEFYWQELYSPGDFKKKNINKQPQIVTVPHTWTNVELAGEKLPLRGYATYRLQIILPVSELGKLQAFYMPSFASAYKLWINGEERGNVGIVAATREAMKPENNPKVITFLPQSNPVEVIIQISNFHQRKAGFDEEILLGEPETIFAYREKAIIYRAIIVTSLMMIGIYHLVLFLFRKRERSFLFFAIVCIVVAIRAILLEEGLATYLLPFLNWEVARKLEYLGATLGIWFIALFTYTQYPREMKRRMRNIITKVFFAYSLFILLTPAVIFTQTMVFLQLLIIATIIYILIVYIAATKARREGYLLNAVATFILFLAMINDVLYFNKLIHTTELASVGLFFFLFTQAIILSKRFAAAFAQSERLSRDLSVLNASLEQQVKARTIEIELASQELFITNKKLQEAQQAKNKWIRNISHEIAAPLTNIRSYSKGMIDGVIPPEQRYLQLIYDQTVYFSHMLRDLHDISDMETNQIKFAFESVHIRSYIRTIARKYQWDIEQQGITFTYIEQLSDYQLVVVLDKIRIEQVIVNLLTNAQRFVKEDGKIVLELIQEKDNYVTIKVHDNGIGISKDRLDTVFNRFYKHNTSGKPHNGAGLGLAISKEIIEYHKGKISVKSVPGEGSCFYFSLPVQEQELET